MANKTLAWASDTPLKCVASADYVNASKLAPAAKAQLWRGIKQSQPALASMLDKDQALKDIMREFSASLVFEKPEFETLMEAGKQPNNG